MLWLHNVDSADVEFVEIRGNASSYSHVIQFTSRHCYTSWSADMFLVPGADWGYMKSEICPLSVAVAKRSGSLGSK